LKSKSSTAKKSKGGGFVCDDELWRYINDRLITIK